jgi:hypothetical protein
MNGNEVLAKAVEDGELLYQEYISLLWHEIVKLSSFPDVLMPFIIDYLPMLALPWPFAMRTKPPLPLSYDMLTRATYHRHEVLSYHIFGLPNMKATAKVHEESWATLLQDNVAPEYIAPHWSLCDLDSHMEFPDLKSSSLLTGSDLINAKASAVSIATGVGIVDDDMVMNQV